MDDNYTVYIHTSPGGKVYIGITGRNPKKRWENGNKYRENKHFFNAIQKYGWDNFRHEILHTGLSKQEAERIEIDLIRMYKAFDPEYGYNVAFGGNANQLGRQRTVDEKRRISESCKHNQTFKDGSKRGAISRTGHLVTDETKKKISQANKGRITNLQKLKPVFCLDDCAVFPSIAAASRVYGISDSCIYRCCIGSTLSAKDKRWAFVDMNTISCENAIWIRNMGV